MTYIEGIDKHKVITFTVTCQLPPHPVCFSFFSLKLNYHIFLLLMTMKIQRNSFNTRVCKLQIISNCKVYPNASHQCNDWRVFLGITDAHKWYIEGKLEAETGSHYTHRFQTTKHSSKQNHLS